MATVSDLKAVLKDTLEKRGVIGQLKASVRAEVFEALDDQSEPRPPLSRENLLINEMIREYLEYNKYKYTASVLNAETGLSEIPLDRQFLARELNIVEDSKSQSVPILYGILSHFLQGHEQDRHFENTRPQNWKGVQETVQMPQPGTSEPGLLHSTNR
ncbi:centrosomal protein 20 [Pelodytes ibericus]